MEELNIKGEGIYFTNTICISSANGEKIIKVKPNGDIFVKGKPMESYKQVVDALRELSSSYIK